MKFSDGDKGRGNPVSGKGHVTAQNLWYKHDFGFFYAENQNSY